MGFLNFYIILVKVLKNLADRNSMKYLMLLAVFLLTSCGGGCAAFDRTPVSVTKEENQFLVIPPNSITVIIPAQMAGAFMQPQEPSPEEFLRELEYAYPPEQKH